MEFENHQYYNCEIEIDDGRVYKISANWMHNNGLDYWKGWECDAGFRRLHVDKNFNVFSAQCENEYLGNLFGPWEPHTAPSICNRDRCNGCTDDLLIRKRLIPAEQKNIT